MESTYYNKSSPEFSSYKNKTKILNEFIYNNNNTNNNNDREILEEIARIIGLII